VIGALEKAAGRSVSRETFLKLEAYADRLKAESEHQNLISASTINALWERHILDSAQLVRFEPEPGVSWVDIGSGAGLPGIVVACLVEGPVTLVEPRKLRAAFLEETTRALGLNATVQAAKAERIAGKFDMITARAVAPLAEFLRISQHLSTRKTVWALPKGRNAQAELAEARRAWQGAFHVEQSVTDAESFIVVGTGVRAR
jgi:16S rRNA (guanine527-N7)-methyltransferase